MSSTADCHSSMLYHCRGFLWYNIWMPISEEDWDMSITSKSMSVPMTKTCFLYVCAKVSAVDIMRWSASAGSCFTSTPACCSSVVNLLISLALSLLLARTANSKDSFLSCCSFHGTLKQNVSRYGLSGAALLFSCFGWRRAATAIKQNNRLTSVVLHCVCDIGLAHLLVCASSWPRYHVEQVPTI